MARMLAALFFLAAGGICIYRALWWSKQDFEIHVSYGSHSRGVEKRQRRGRNFSWSWCLLAAGLLCVLFGLWQLVAISRAA